jgi:methyl-accepting chemotaxis protein
MRNKRRLILINKSFQLKFFLWFFASVSLLNFFFYMTIVYLFSSFVEMGAAVGLSGDNPYFSLIAEQKERMSIVFGGSYFIEVVILMVFSYIFSHRIAGPIHRLKIWLGDVAQGKEVQALSFRKEDFFSELPEVVNRAIESVKNPKE